MTGDSFTRFWISYNQGNITVGLGEPGIDSPNYSWTDPDPIPNVKHVGLSTWDKHVGYRQIQMQPAVSRKPAATQQRQEPLPQLGAHSLKWLCRQSIEQHLCPENLCSLLHGVEELAPALDELREPLMSCLADNLEEVVVSDHDGFCSLPSTCLADLLDRPGLVRLPFCYVHLVLVAAAALLDDNQAASLGRKPCLQCHLVTTQHAQAKVVNLAVMPVLAASVRQFLLVLPVIYYAELHLCCIITDSCKAFG